VNKCIIQCNVDYMNKLGVPLNRYFTRMCNDVYQGFIESGHGIPNCLLRKISGPVNEQVWNQVRIPIRDQVYVSSR